MKQPPEKPGLALRLVAAILTASTFGAGVLVGRLFLGRPSSSAPTDEQSGESAPDADNKNALAVCRQALAALPKTRSVSGADVDAGILEPAARIEALKARIKTCRKSEVLVNATICSSVGRHYAAMMALPDNGVLCIQRARAASFIEEDFEKCDELDRIPADLDMDSLTKDEQSTLLDAVNVRKTITEDELRKRLGNVYDACFKTAEKSTPL